jgi:membrane protein YdbS with pleckstrin-like domain
MRVASRDPASNTGHWDWWWFGKTVAVLLLAGVVAGWAMTRRKVVRWDAQTKHLEDTHVV